MESSQPRIQSRRLVLRISKILALQPRGISECRRFEEFFPVCFDCDGKEKTVLSGRTVWEEIKETCHLRNLLPNYFSLHFLRKGAITHMRSLGSTEDDRRDRGNYAPGSQVMNTTYDYATSLGPLAANSIAGGQKPSMTDVRRLLPAKRK